MAPADVNVYVMEIAISKETKYCFIASAECIIFPGFLTVTGYAANDDILEKLPKCNDSVEANEIKCSQEYNRPPLRYSEAGLIKKMDPKNLNIGRPATYAEIINTIQKRKYVEIKDIPGIEKETVVMSWNKETQDDNIKTVKKMVNIGKELKKFVPTELGKEVNKTMLKYFPDIMNYTFTSQMEQMLDDIADGKIAWTEVLINFWKKIYPSICKIQEEKKKENLIGCHPVDGSEIYATMGQFGPMLVMHKNKDSKKNAVIRAPIKAPYNIDNITLENALEILEYPKVLGTKDKFDVELKKGQYGFYLEWRDIRASISNDIDVKTLTFDMAIEIIDKKQQQKDDYTKSCLYYKLDGNTEYIIRNGNYENNRYLMVKNIGAKKKVKPLFIKFPIEKNVEMLSFDEVKQFVENNQKPKKKHIYTKNNKN